LEIGIAEQNLVSIAAGLAACGKKAYAVSPACFLSTRAYEQCKIDAAYSRTNVKLIGISGGVSYGALGMSHHSLQDIAALSAIPNMRVYIPSDCVQSTALIRELLKDREAAYVRVGRNAVPRIYGDDYQFVLDNASVLSEGTDALIIACGEMVRPALDAVAALRREHVNAALLDMYCVKPLDTASVIKYAEQARVVVTVEEHSPFGGLGSIVAQAVSENCPRRLICMSLPDAPVVSGTSREIFDYYGLTAEGIADKVRRTLQCT
jgi:transketolase